MRASEYDGIHDHADEHRELFYKLTGAVSLFNNFSSGVEIVILDFFYKWFLDHVSSSDRKFGEFLLHKCSA